MDELVQKLCHGHLARGEERKLLREHIRHFARRVRALDASFFPGREKSRDGIKSLANGAYASFRSEPIYDGEPAFRQVTLKRLPAKGYLYFWRSSATIRYLRHEASGELKTRLRLLRNVRIHLRQGFREVGATCGEALWAPSHRELQPRYQRPDLDAIDVDLARLRGKAAIDAVFEAAGVPLTRNEIAAIIERAHGLRAPKRSPGVDVESVPSDPRESLDRRAAERQLGHRVRRFVDSLGEETLRLLRARGYGGTSIRSLRDVATDLGGSQETLRRRERRAFERFRAVFADPTETEHAARLLAAALASAEVSS